MIEITINNVPVSVKEWHGERVVTLKDIDTVHGRPKETAGRNFRANRKHLIEGVDYYKVCTDEIRRDNIMDLHPKARGNIILMTETGYLMLVKSFTDDLAWDVQRQLVNTYFTVKQIATKTTWDSIVSDEELREIADRKKEQERMKAQAQYHLLKSGALLKQAEYEMAQCDLLRCMVANPWLAEADSVQRLEENHVRTQNPQH